MNILHVVNRYWPSIGGAERYFQEISERLVAEGHRVTVVTTTAQDLEGFWDPRAPRLPAGEETRRGVRILRLPLRHLPGSPFAYRGTRRLMSILSRLPLDAASLLEGLGRVTPWVVGFEAALGRLDGPFDLVHAGNVAFESIVVLAQRWAQRRGLPLVVTPFVHLGEPNDDAVRRYYTMRHQVRLLSRARRVVVQTDLEGEHLAGLGVERSRLIRIGVGVTPDEVEGGTASRFRERNRVFGPIVFYLGPLAYDKGTHHLVEAMELLWERGLEAELVLAGWVPKEFRRFLAARSDAARKRCHLLGRVSEESKRDLLAAGEVMAMPSRTDSFGIVYLEAWANGKPVIGARAGGVPEVISDGEDGYLVDFGDVPALADRIASLLRDPRRAAEMGERGRQKTFAEHTWDRKYAQVRSLYQELVGG